MGIGSTANVTFNNISQTVSNFQVNSDGTFFARNGYIKGKIIADEGEIGTNVIVRGTLSAANITTGTVNNKTVSWQSVDVVTNFRAHSESRKWISDLRGTSNGGLSWINHTGTSVYFVSWDFDT
jgi:hypothetical protein